MIEIFQHCWWTSFRITEWRRQYWFFRKALKLLSDTATSQQRSQYSSGSSKWWQETDYLKSACNYEYVWRTQVATARICPGCIWRTQVATARDYQGKFLRNQNFPNFKYLQYVNILCCIDPQSTLKDFHKAKDSARSQRGPNSKHGTSCSHQQPINAGVFKTDWGFFTFCR